MPTKLEMLKAKADKAKIEYEVCRKRRTELLKTMKEKYGISTVDEAVERMEAIANEISELSDKRDNLVNKAEELLEGYERSE